MILTVPRDDTLFPTLGPQVCDFIEQNLIFGPGDLRGQPVILDDEKVALIYRMYEVHPQGHRLAGRRRFKRVGISVAKGLGKTELAAWITACELHPDAPVRCIGWTASGEPIGGPVTDPYIPLLAVNEEQSHELAYETLRVILEQGPLRDDFDIGLERILRRKGDGKCVSLSSSPNARDGARTTFCVGDETHHWTLARLKQAHQTMLANLAKRKAADPWMLEITTAPEPGAGSVAERTMEYAHAVAAGLVPDATLFYFHRQASDGHDLATREGAEAAIREASGAAAGWRDLEAILALWADPSVDRAYWERVWCNRLVRSSTQAFDVGQWTACTDAENPVRTGDRITLGFDGAQFQDATGIVATHLETGYQWVAGLWECPYGRDLAREPWQVPADEVDATVQQLFTDYTVWRLYADPPYWQSWIAQWAGRFGKERVLEWWTNRPKPMAAALESFDTAIKERQLRHGGPPDLKRHLGNARKHFLPSRDEDGRPLWVIRKDRPDSPYKIDLAMAAVLSWEARTDGIAAGVLKPPPSVQLFVLGAGR